MVKFQNIGSFICLEMTKINPVFSTHIICLYSQIISAIKYYYWWTICYTMQREMENVIRETGRDYLDSTVYAMSFIILAYSWISTRASFQIYTIIAGQFAKPRKGERENVVIETGKDHLDSTLYAMSLIFLAYSWISIRASSSALRSKDSRITFSR